MRRRRSADAPTDEAIRSTETTDTPGDLVARTNVETNENSTSENEKPDEQLTIENQPTSEPEARKGRRRSGARKEQIPEDASSQALAVTSGDETVPPPAAVDAPAAEDAPAPETPRRKRTSSRTAKEAVTEVSNPVVADPPVVEATVEPPPKAKRSSKRSAKVEPETSEIIVSPVIESVAEPVISEPVTQARNEGQTRKRSRIPKSNPTSIPVVLEGNPVTNETVETVPTPTASETTVVTPEQPSSVPVETNVAPAPVVPPAPVRVHSRGGRPSPAEAKPTPPPATDNNGSRRTRGVRQRTPARTTTTVSSPSILPQIPVEPTTAETGEDTTNRRVRGLRRTINRPTTVVTPVVVAPVPVEVIPPRYQPLPAETLQRLAEGKVSVRNGIPELWIAGEPRVPMLFFVNTEDAETADTAIRQIRLAYDAGVRIFTVLAHLPWKGRSGERRFDPLDNALQMFAENAPDAFVLPRLIFSPPPAWIKQNEGEMTKYADGEIGDVSLASTAFWEGEAEEALQAAVEHVAQGKYAGRVFGFYLEHGEWFYEKGRGYDLSEANRKGFRNWLRNRYRNNQIALRAAWFDTSVTFDKAEIPAFPPPSNGTQFFSRREPRYRDYHEYASDIVAQVILNLGKTVKEASANRLAVAVSYGYTLELPRAASGHLSLAQVLNSPYIDILTGPLSYSDRIPGGSAPLPVPVDSVHLAGKLWISEDDTKTHLSADDTPDSYNPKIDNADSTWAVHSRNFGAAIARGAGISYMDLWGQGWLEDRELWRKLGRLRLVAERIGARRRSLETTSVSAPDVAIIVDERSFFDVRNDEKLLGSLVTGQRDALLRSGARIGFYLLSDLTKPEFPESVRLIIFLNAFRLPDSVRIAIKERFQNSGRTLAWLYGPGCLEENLAELTDVIGMSVRLQPWGSKSGTQILPNARSPLTDALRGQKLGEEVRCNPNYYVTDVKAQVLGEYINSGNPSLVVRKHARWQSVFIGEPVLPLALLRGLYRLAGVPTFTTDDDVAWVGDNLICLHSAPGGGTNVFIPEDGVLVDLLTDEVLAIDGYGARLSMPPRGTRLLFFGKASDVTRFGIEARSGPAGLKRSELPSLPQIAFEEVENLPPGLSAEDEAMLASVLTGDLTIPDKDEDDEPALPEVATTVDVVPEVATESESSRKRRRRRRRRGRGGKEADEIDAALDGALDGELEEDETVIDVVPDPVSRIRPSLEELLPLSDIPVDSDQLPPIPDEFLPLNDEGLSESEQPSESVRGRNRPRRGGNSRRNRRLGNANEPANDEIIVSGPESDVQPITEDVIEETVEGEAAITGTTDEVDSPVQDELPVAESTTEETSTSPLAAYDIF